MSVFRMTVHWPDVTPRVLLDGPRTLAVRITGVGLVCAPGGRWRPVLGSIVLPVGFRASGAASVVRTLGVDGLRRHPLTVAAERRLALPIVPALRHGGAAPRRKPLLVRSALPPSPGPVRPHPAVVRRLRLGTRRLDVRVPSFTAPSFLAPSFPAPARVRIDVRRVVLALPGRLPREVLRSPRRAGRSAPPPDRVTRFEEPSR